MEKTLKPLVDSLITLVQSGVDFVKGQIPDVAQQILHYKAAEAWVNLFFPFIVVGLLILLLRFFINGLKLHKGYNNEGWWVGTIFTAAGLGIASIVALCSAYDSIITLIKISYAPKLFLLEYLRTFLK